MKKVNLFIDMDGVLAVYKKDTHKYIYDKGFFANRPPITKMLEVTRKLIALDLYNVYILSTVMDTPYCTPEKRVWLKKYLPEMREDNYMFVPFGTVKSNFAQDNVDTKDSINVLIDDFTENLNKWTLPGALPIKLLNGINSNMGTWLGKGGDYISSNNLAEETLGQIRNLIRLEQNK